MAWRLGIPAAGESARLQQHQGMLILLVRGPHFENDYLDLILHLNSI